MKRKFFLIIGLIILIGAAQFFLSCETTDKQTFLNYKNSYIIEIVEPNEVIIVIKTENIYRSYIAFTYGLKEVISKAVYTKIVDGRGPNRLDDFELVLSPKLPVSNYNL